MPSELQLQVSPEIAANESLLYENVAKLVRVSTKLVHKVVILKRSIDARQKVIKINLKVSVCLIDEKYIEKNTNKALLLINQNFYRPAEVELLLGDSTKARQELGWQPKTSFKELVDKMVKHDILDCG